jgi:hypothetical protein
MVCAMSTSTECENSAGCAAGVTCPTPAPGPSQCTTTTSGTCSPTYDLPCKLDADCGPGFTCVADQICSCSGGGAVSSVANSSAGGASTSSSVSDGGALVVDAGEVTVDPVPPTDFDASCGCSLTGTSICQLNPIACTVVSDCPSGWTCDTMPAACSCPAIAFADGGAPPCICPDSGSSGSCTPPYWNGGSGHAATLTSNPSAGADAGAGILVEGSYPADASLPVVGSSSGAYDDAGAPSAPMSQSVGAAPSASDQSQDGGGLSCQVGVTTTPSRSAASLLSLLLVALGVTIGRRRSVTTRAR